jgi:hypothetical protein
MESPKSGQTDKRSNMRDVAVTQYVSHVAKLVA